MYPESPCNHDFKEHKGYNKILKKNIWKCIKCGVIENEIKPPVIKIEMGCTCKDCLKKVENQEKHLNHPFYQEVKAFTDEVEREQILKGAEKYPEPFNPDSWTNDELAVHAMQEFRDGQVYVTGMRDRMRKQEALINQIYACFDDETETIKESFFKIKKMVDDYHGKRKA